MEMGATPVGVPLPHSFNWPSCLRLDLFPGCIQKGCRFSRMVGPIFRALLPIREIKSENPYNPCLLIGHVFPAENACHAPKPLPLFL